MNKEELFQIIGDIDDDLIAEAADAGNAEWRLRKKKKWLWAVAAAAIMLMGIAVGAAAILAGSTMKMQEIPAYRTAPSAEALKEDVGFSAKILETFENGYQFHSGYIVGYEDYAGDGSVANSYTGVSFRYLLADAQVTLEICSAEADGETEGCRAEEAYRGSVIRYWKYAFKVVPDDYRMTAQDKADQRSGKYVFSYGGTAVEIIDVQLTEWEYNGLQYNLCALDSTLTGDELAAMAREYIDEQE